MAAASPEIDAALLIEARDELAVIRDLVVCLCLACSSPILPRDERTALSQLALLVRERLEGLARSLEQMMPPIKPRPATAPKSTEDSPPAVEELSEVEQGSQAVEQVDAWLKLSLRCR